MKMFATALNVGCTLASNVCFKKYHCLGLYKRFLFNWSGVKPDIGYFNCFTDVVQRACALQSDRPGFASSVVLGKLIFLKLISSSAK